MGLTVALIATLALAASAPVPQDAAGWRAQSEALYAQGDFPRRPRGGRHARVSSNRRIPGHATHGSAPSPRSTPMQRGARCRVSRADEALKAFPDEDRARLRDGVGLPLPRPRHRTAGGLALRRSPRLGRKPSAGAGRARHPGRPARQRAARARAFRRGAHDRAGSTRRSRNSSAIRAMTSCCTSSRPPATCATPMPPGAPIPCSTNCGRITRRRCRHARTSRTCAATCPRGSVRLRDLLEVDPKAPGAASELSDTLLALNRPYDAYDVARRMAPERLARDAALQAIEREWVPHFEVALDGAWRSGQTDHDRLDLPGVQIAWSGSDARWGRLRLQAEALLPGIRPRARRRAVRYFRRAAGAVRFADRQGNRRARAMGAAQRTSTRARHDADFVRRQQPRRRPALPVRLGVRAR